MKKTNLILSFAAVIIMLSLSGCHTSSSLPSGITTYGTPGVTPVATSTVIPAATAVTNTTVTVSGSVMIAMGSITGSISLMNGAVPVTGATVTLNGQVLAETPGGTYQNSGLTGISTGTLVNFLVATSAGNVSASGVMPASGAGPVYMVLSGGSVSSVVALIQI